MILELNVKNFAIVADQNIQFDPKLILFTGETGAGKSLLLQAITLLLGAKGDVSCIRSGAPNAEVEGVFDLSMRPEKIQEASDMGFALDEEESTLLMVRREIASKSSRMHNRIWIQGKSATRAQLQKLLGDWIEISGQHEFLRLNKEEYILDLLDQYANLSEERTLFQKVYGVALEKKQELERLEKLNQELQEKFEFYRFQQEEFEKAGVSSELLKEEEEMQRIRNELGSAEKIKTALQKALYLLKGSDNSSSNNPGTLEILKKINREISPLTENTSSFDRTLELSSETSSFAMELEQNLEEQLYRFESNPEALEDAESRLSQINRLKRKYVVDTEGLIKLAEKIQKELNQSETLDKDLPQLKKESDKAYEKAQALALKLHEQRNSAAKKLSQELTREIKSLGIKDGEISFEATLKEQLNSSGLSLAQILFSANKGSALKSISKVASGGELSRILLALKQLISETAQIGVYLFDEVDAGIGGETAHVVGSKLKFIAQKNQVLVVSHLAQVAAYADQHFRVEKNSEGKQTQTCIVPLKSKKERHAEIARMLGGTQINAAHTLAKELIQKAVAHI